jgi:hypothetical protein
MRRTLTALTATLMPNACGGSSPTAPSLLPSDLAAAPTRVILAGKSLVLDASLWRDFMPISPPDGRPLTAVLQVRAEDGSQVPATVGADMVWVLNGADAWSTVPREERSRNETAPIYELVARDGPKWGPGITVDVVVRLHDQGGRDSLLRVANRPIQGTF